MKAFEDIVIVAYAEAKNEKGSGRTAYDLAGEVLSGLVERSGIGLDQIDGLAASPTMSEGANPFYSVFMAELLGLQTSWLQGMDLGGASSIAGLHRAAMAIRSGACETVALIAADSPSTAWTAQFDRYDAPKVGLLGPPGAFALLMNRYDHLYRLKPEALGKLAVTQRAGAVQNPNAYERFRKPLTLEQYFQSPMLSEPIRVLDCVMYLDGASGVLITSRANAERRKLKSVRPIAYREVSNFRVRDLDADMLESGFATAGPKALADAGLRPDQIQMFHPYDDFTFAILLQLEQIGFCKRGEGSEFILSTDLSPRGRLALNTGGGQISAGQPGLASGGLNLVEAVRQLMGEAGERQVPNPRNAMVTGIGSIAIMRNWNVSNVLILEVGQ
ncbi:MAG: thiolase family protein [Hyphomicrobiaceae bacterium]|nr:MAG: thiolase family protein [Hyphomicrobiaceae bacterium]